jgi:KUP system potassium uptake protein
LLISAMHRIWKWPLAWTVIVGGVFAVVDLAFFGANLVKIPEGGWIPLTLALQETVIELTVRMVERPYARRRATAHCVGDTFWRVTVSFGFNEVPNLLEALENIETFDASVDFRKVIYFGARDLVVHNTSHPRLSRWQLALFAFLFRNSVKTMDRFHLPSENFVEIAREISI